jgi:hypothetical protein
MRVINRIVLDVDRQRQSPDAELLQQIELLPKRDQEALLRTINAFLSKTRTA